MEGVDPPGMRDVPDRNITLSLQVEAGEQADLKARIREIARTRVALGYRRVHVLLRREGRVVNPKRIYRLYKEMDLQPLPGGGLNADWFLSLDDARAKMEEWRQDNKTVRSHSAIGNKPP